MAMRARSSWPVFLICVSFLLSLSYARPVSAAGDTRLVDAVKHGKNDAARDLLKQRVDVNVPLPDGTTALHWAVEHSDADMVSALVGAGANTNAETAFGVTPLSLACKNGDAAVVRVLLRSGAKPNA